MFSITQVSQPCLQRRRIVFLDDRAVSDDLRGSGNGGPFARRVQEGDVDVRVGLDVGGFA
jgi:hypothetical protein